MKLFRHDLSQLASQLPTWQWVIGSAMLLLVIWGIDYAIHVNLGLSFFYVLPIAAIAWYVAPQAGYLMGLIGAVLWFIAESARTPPDTLPCTHISALTPSVPLSQNWARGRPDKAFRLPFSRFGRRGWGMREKP